MRVDRQASIGLARYGPTVILSTPPGACILGRARIPSTRRIERCRCPICCVESCLSVAVSAGGDAASVRPDFRLHNQTRLIEKVVDPDIRHLAAVCLYIDQKHEVAPAGADTGEPRERTRSGSGLLTMARVGSVQYSWRRLGGVVAGVGGRARDPVADIQTLARNVEGTAEIAVGIGGQESQIGLPLS